MDIIINDTQKKSFDNVESSYSPIEPFYRNILLSILGSSESIPLANLLRSIYKRHGEWFIFTPIHWDVTHNDAMLTAFGKELGLSTTDSEDYMQQIYNFLKEDIEEILFHSPDIWLVKMRNAPKLYSPAPDDSCHHSLFPIISKMDDTHYWQRVFTEIQMFIASTQFTASSPRKDTCNGVWIWGHGAMPYRNTTLWYRDEALFSVLSEMGDAVFLEDSKADTVREGDIVILSQWDENLKALLQPSLKRYESQWYWNDMREVKPPNSLLRRLWRKVL
jgi:hypothetical protein